MYKNNVLKVVGLCFVEALFAIGSSVVASALFA